MAGYFSTLGSALIGRSVPKASPYTDVGVPGTAIFGGYVENIERDHRLAGRERYRTAADILANVSIVAAGLRYFLNLAAAPKWSVEPAKDQKGAKDESSDAAKEAAEFFQSVLDDMATSWPRIVRRSAMYRFHGFGVQEWTAKRRDDGKIGILDVESRPQHTIEQWSRDESGSILGMGQRSPQTGELIWLPRTKVMYLVDDSLTDSPEGMGWFRHLVDPAERLRKYLKLEGQGYERDMRGIPMGRAPLAEIRQAVKDGKITKDEGEKMLAGMRAFLRAQSKAEDTGILVDSATYTSVTADGTNVSAANKWFLELLTGGAMGFPDIAKAIDRLTRDMALILGVEGLLLGNASSTSGNRSLSEDKSKNLYTMVNGTLSDIAEAAERDVRDPIWKLNGFPDELKPRLKVEDASFKDAAMIAAGLRDLGMAGLQPNDPAINDLRDLWGISREPEMTPEMMGMLGHNGGPPLDPAKDPAEGQTPAPGQEGA